MLIKTNLQAMRKRAGFKSARVFAEHMGIPTQTYTNYEQGKANFTLLQAWEFADELGCTLDELAGRRSPTEEGASLASDEQIVLDGYRTLDVDGRRRVRRMLNGELEDMEMKAAEKRGA